MGRIFRDLGNEVTHKFIVFLSLIMVIGPVTGCSNTANGAGKDMENMGRWIKKNS